MLASINLGTSIYANIETKLISLLEYCIKQIFALGNPRIENSVRFEFRKLKNNYNLRLKVLLGNEMWNLLINLIKPQQIQRELGTKIKKPAYP